MLDLDGSSRLARLGRVRTGLVGRAAGWAVAGVVGVVGWEEAASAGACFEVVAVVGLELVAGGAEGVGVVELGDGVDVAFENVGPQWERDEPWQTQQAKIAIRGLTDPSPWMRHQRRLLFGGLGALVALLAIAVLVASLA